MRNRQTLFDRILVGAALIGALLVLVLPTVNTGFLSDDLLDLHHEFSAESFTRFAFIGYRPLNEAVYAVDARMWGAQKAWGWHITNILIHAVCAILFWRAALHLSGSRRTAALAVAFFLVSFATVPSFARVSGRTTPVAMAPLLGAVIMHSRWVSGRKVRDLILGLTLFLVSLFSKETALLCAPLFGMITVNLMRGEGSRTKAFFRVTALYLVPTALYLALRFTWIGFAFGYADSARFGPFMLGNLLTLFRMSFSPWLDGIPLRILLILAAVVLFMARAPWRTRLMLVSLIVLPAVTMVNLPPRSYYAYAALPGAALLFGMTAVSLRGWRGGVVVSVVLLGCLLSARDEVSRFLQADDYTSRMIVQLDSLNTSCPGDAFVFISGIDYEVADYSTLWPGAFIEALSTIGSDGSRLLEESSLWEVCWPVIELGGHPSCVFARISETGFDTLHLDPSFRFQPQVPPDTLVSPVNGRIEITGRLLPMKSCSVPGTGRLLVSDPFDRESWIELQPFESDGRTTVYDLESCAAWLLADTSGSAWLLMPDGDGEIAFSGSRLWLEPLEEVLASKNGSFQQSH